jgi:peptidoglycan/LPS O-acetylase OafA/YrhL/lysophospholipase L1-like esterase
MPGLDGLRAVAVLAVIAFHLGLAAMPGGLLGVGIFFTLSGYLITDLLLAQRARGGISLRGFWLGRARRLLPALFLMLALVTAWVTLIGPPQPPDFRGAVAAAVLYVNNWWQIFHHVSYFARFGPPSPLNHLWSLAVEEQFYLLWPFLLLIGLRFVKETRPRSGLYPRLAVVTVGLAVASAIEMAVLFHPSLDASRAYYGTDTRACELLAGAALAMVWPSRRLRANVTPSARRVLDGMGVAGLLAIAVMIWRTGQYSGFLYRGGFVLLSVATVLVIAAIAHPACKLGPALGREPLRWIGVRSYGIYLYHFPIIVLTTPASDHGFDLVRAIPQVAAIVAVSALSWRYVEEPIRHGALGRLFARLRAEGWRPEALPQRGRLALAGLAIVLAVAAAGLAGVGSGLTGGPSAAAGSNIAKTIKAPGSARTAANTLPGQSSCRAVIHIGDSTSEGLDSPDYLPNPSERISAQYARVGATTQHLEIAGARSIVETNEGVSNAYTVAQEWIRRGYNGCWVLALGTNDAANVFVSPNTDELTRIERMMSVIGDRPVLWVNVRSLLQDGPYSEQDMERWNTALLEECQKYPNMRVFDWASEVQDDWFIDDGIHFTSFGYAQRSRSIADALAHAFPATGPAQASGCVVH